jgi:hypothetical protein
MSARLASQFWRRVRNGRPWSLPTRGVGVASVGRGPRIRTSRLPGPPDDHFPAWPVPGEVMVAFPRSLCSELRGRERVHRVEELAVVAVGLPPNPSAPPSADEAHRRNARAGASGGSRVWVRLSHRGMLRVSDVGWLSARARASARFLRVNEWFGFAAAVSRGGSVDVCP